MGEKEISEFLTFLAVERKVSASTQNPPFAKKQSKNPQIPAINFND